MARRKRNGINQQWCTAALCIELIISLAAHKSQFQETLLINRGNPDGVLKGCTCADAPIPNIFSTTFTTASLYGLWSPCEKLIQPNSGAEFLTVSTKEQSFFSDASNNLN
ncbi:MAG TPA: hypothetical protein VI685_17445, partial [Candidatus Angelobacter sp.]